MRHGLVPPAVRQIYPGPAGLDDRELATRYSYPDPAGGAPYWLRANMVASLDGAATVGGRSGGLSGRADQQVFALLRALADVVLVGAGTARVEGYRPVRPRHEGARWAWLRAGRTPSPPIAVVTRRLDLDLESPLLAGEGAPDEVVAARGLAVVSDEGALTAAVDEAIAANPEVAQKVRDGKVAAAGALVGAVMKATRGQANAARVRELILDRLGPESES